MNNQEHPFLIIVILNWNAPNDTKECVESLIPQLKPEYKILIIDNGSTDNSISFLQNQFPLIQIIENKRNLGYQGGMNVGIKASQSLDSEFVLLLNNDTISDPNMIEILIKSFPADASLVSPMLYYYESPQKLWSIGGKINPVILEVTNNKRLPKPRGQMIKRDFLPSCAWLIKCNLFNEIGYLDEMFFPIYYDDLDFCLRIKENGSNIYLIPDAKIWHKVSQSMGGQYSPNERFIMARNSGYYFRKHSKPLQLPIILACRLVSAILWTIRLLFFKKPNVINAYWRGLWLGWFGKLPESSQN